MRVLVSGASGLIGRRLCTALGDRGDEIVRLVRGTPRGVGEVLWDPRSGRFEHAAAEGCDAVIHLAGESVAAGRWNDARKRAIFESRVGGTRLLCEGLRGLERPPAVLVCASAVGFYGSSGDAPQTESSPAGAGFLAEVCKAWEAAADPARQKGIRVVHVRIGLVLAGEGGALARMLPAFRVGLGGRIGDGQQWMSWIDAEDLVSVFLHAVDQPTLSGPANAVSPQPVRNTEFTATLARALGRPTLLPVPAFALRLVLGEMADELLLSSTRAVPEALERKGFRFRHAELEASLRHLLPS